MSATRRTLLAGLTLPALASGYPAPLAAATGHAPPHPDAALLALATTIPALAESSLALGRVRDRIDTACFGRAGPLPEHPQCKPSDLSGRGDFDDEAMEAWRVDARARDARLVAAGTALGLGDAERAYDEAEGALLDACRILAGIRATTTEGLIAKARVAEAQEISELRDSIVADLVAMGGTA